MSSHRLPLICCAELFLAATPQVFAAILYNAPLTDGNYGGGFKVGVYSAANPFNASGSTGGSLAPLGIIDSSAGVMFTTANDVINFSLGADGKGGAGRATFRTTGTVSVMFRANRDTFITGQPFVDNYGFNQFNSGQGSFGTALARHNGPDNTPNTQDDRIEFSWTSWHNNVWYNHVDTAADQVVTTMNQWHHLGMTWGGPTNKFEVWLDGQLAATDARNLGAWGASYLGLGSGYNFALGEIHERVSGNNSARGIEFANLHIWDEVRPLGDTTAIPEPATVWITVAAALALALRPRRR